MGEYLRPGVFVEEVAAEAVPIEGVGTSTGAFEGVTERGALDLAKLITNWSQFVKHFGAYLAASDVAYAVRGFFDNGGRRCYVVRVAGATPASATATLVDRDASPLSTLQVDALNEGTWGNSLTVSIEAGTLDATNEFKIIVKESAVVVEIWDNLSMIDTDTNFVETVINGNSNYIQVTDLDSATTPPDDMPALQADTALSGGTNGAAIADANYTGNQAAKTGIYAFDAVDDINLLSIPGVQGTANAVTIAAIAYCENRKDCAFVADDAAGNTPAQAKTWRLTFDTSYGFYYFPWLQIVDSLTDALRYIPNSGHVMGVMARRDGERGVHVAPANEVVRAIVGLQYPVTHGEQEVLNPAGVNCIRFFRGRGIRVWGARTMSSDATLRYVHKRRFLMFLEESVDEGTQFAVFEPNDQRLWSKITRSVGGFLRRQWLEGALFGAAEADAYYVKCNSETNPPEVRAAGKVITEVGVRIVETAEFVIFRIGQWAGGSSVTEL